MTDTTSDLSGHALPESSSLGTDPRIEMRAASKLPECKCLGKDIFFNTEVATTSDDQEAIASDIHKHLRESEANRMPSEDCMEKIQKGSIDAAMRAILIDWLVQVAEEEFKFVPDILFLAVNYIDRYLSGTVLDRKQLQLLGATCMMIAAKYETEKHPPIQTWCDITDNTYVKTEFLQMESAVLHQLKYEMTAPTAMCFLRRFCFVAHQSGDKDTYAPPEVHFRSLALYIAELSLVQYKMVCYPPSLLAASAIFLAKFLLSPSTRPWNSTLRHSTLYQASDLCDCVQEMHDLVCYDSFRHYKKKGQLTAVRSKYSQPKYQSVAIKYLPPPDSIPPEFFNIDN